MKILEYCFKDKTWDFSRVSFDKVNLLVGLSGSGKTRLLNTIFNLGRVEVGVDNKHGRWEAIIENNNSLYNILLDIRKDEQDNIKIYKEEIIETSNNVTRELVKRDSKTFYFLGEKLPKLSLEQTSISLLKDTDEIKPIYQGFSSIVRRNFSGGSLNEIVQPVGIDKAGIDKVAEQFLEKPSLTIDHLNVRLYFLKNYYQEKFNIICDLFKAIFPFIQQIKITEMQELSQVIMMSNLVPIFSIKEKNSDIWIPSFELSTGMQKVLLIITDLITLPSDYIYLIDEYENSLGINSIDFITELLGLTEINQFLITSHHPYIINNIPVKDWHVLHRRGSKVQIKYGDEIVARFGKSKQQAFIKLINDSFFVEGIE